MVRGKRRGGLVSMCGEGWDGRNQLWCVVVICGEGWDGRNELAGRKHVRRMVSSGVLFLLFRGGEWWSLDGYESRPR